jgi:hypothetical protein
MTEAEALAMVRAHMERQFPMACTCGVQFPTLREYMRKTTPVGPTVSYDADIADWTPPQPLGFLALANCACGSTLALTTEGMPLATRHALLDWLKGEIELRRVSPTAVLGALRADLRADVLREPTP